MQPDLSPAARDIQHRLEALALAHPEASAPVLVWMLALEYVPARLKRRHR